MNEILSVIFSNHNGMKLEKQQKEKWKIHKYVEAEQHTHEQLLDPRRNKKEIRKYLETKKNKTKYAKTYGRQHEQHKKTCRRMLAVLSTNWSPEILETEYFG